MEPRNEIEALLLSSLNQLSEEFEAREQNISAQYTACMESFSEQVNALRSQYEQVLQQLNISTARYEEVMKLLQNLNVLLSR
jgi:ABC-type transporter Mla subunit MlaD